MITSVRPTNCQQTSAQIVNAELLFPPRFAQIVSLYVREDVAIDWKRFCHTSIDTAHNVQAGYAVRRVLCDVQLTGAWAILGAIMVRRTPLKRAE